MYLAATKSLKISLSVLWYVLCNQLLYNIGLCRHWDISTPGKWAIATSSDNDNNGKVYLDKCQQESNKLCFILTCQKKHTKKYQEWQNK
jgi:hypothetical protein